MDPEGLLREVGEFGLYQRLTLLFFGFYHIVLAMNHMGLVFIMESPDHRCRVDPLDSSGLSFDEVRNISIPRSVDGTWSRCSMYEVNYSLGQHIVNHTVADCKDGWVYDQSDIISSAATEFDLVCERAWLRAVASSIYFLGDLTGSIALGIISDSYGRRTALLVGSFGSLVAAVTSALAPVFPLFVFLRFLVSTFTTGAEIVAYVYIVEIVSSRYSLLVVELSHAFFTVGYVIVAGMGYALRNHTHFILAVAGCHSVCLGTFFLVPESVRWLYAKGRRQKAWQIFSKIAEINGRAAPKMIRQDGTHRPTSQVPKVIPEGHKTPLANFCYSRRWRIHTFLLSAVWGIIGLMYFTLSLNSSNIGGDIYTNFLLLATIEIPGLVVAVLLPLYLGRKKPISASMFLGGIILLASLAVPLENNVGQAVIAVLGKMTGFFAYCVIYAYGCEVFPTAVRSFGVGIGMFSGSLGAILSSYVLQLSDISRHIPLVVCGALSILGGLLMLPLPETKGKTLTETVNVDETEKSSEKKDMTREPSPLKEDMTYQLDKLAVTKL